MASRKALVVIATVTILFVSVVGPAAAHSWQDEVTQGPMELGVSSSPQSPVAGMQTEFSARIADEDPEGDEDRLDWGGVTNRSVEVHIRGPNDFHDHVKTSIPEDEAHMDWTYMFPTDGTYTIAVVTEIEGQEYAFEFQREVSLLPARVEGDSVDNVNENVQELQQQVDEINDQVNSHQQQTSTSLSGIGLTVGLAIAVGAVAFFAGRRF